MGSTKLNLFQRGLLQKTATIFAYLGSIAIGAFILDWFEKESFIAFAEQAKQQGIITPEGFNGLKLLIESRDPTTIFAVILIGLLCIASGWFFMRWSAKRNWSWPVTLPKAVEFRWAMEQFGIIEPGERINFVRKHKLPVFIALSPLLEKEQKAVRARYYAFAHDPSLGDKDIFELHTGKQTLCLNVDDYERFLQEYGPKTKSAYSARIAELEQKIIDLKAVNSLLSADIAKILQEKETLLTEKESLQRKQQTTPGRESRTAKRENAKIPFWRVAAPVINRLIAESGEGTQYTRRDIQDAFLEELEKFPDLKPIIQKLLHTPKKEDENTPFALEGWGMNAIRTALGNLAKKEPGATPKNKKHRVL